MSPFTVDQLALATELLEKCRAQGLRIATAESCTGGLIAACLTAVAGSSDVVERGFVTYTNEAKSDMLGVPEALFPVVGAVSQEVALAMAKGAQERSQADLSVSVTGVAGPGGGSETKPVGLVHLAVASITNIQHQEMLYDGNRDQVRSQTVITALEMLLEATGRLQVDLP